MAKYKKFDAIMPKLFFIFLAIFVFLYARTYANVTYNETRVPLQKEVLAIAEKKGLSIITDGKIYFLPLQGTYAWCIDNDNHIIIATEKFIGKVILGKKSSIFIDTLLVSKGKWSNPQKLIFSGKDIYLATQKALYLLENKDLLLIDSAKAGLEIFGGNASLYILKNSRLFIVKDKKIRELLTKSYSRKDILAIQDRIIHEDRKFIFFRWWAWLVYAAIIGLIIALNWLRRRRDFEMEKAKLEKIISERTAELTKEKEKTDHLLANLLPKETAEELKNKGKATSQKFTMATVLFSDIQGFTKIAEQMNPEKLIDELDNFFFYFDSVVEKYNIEKIKTIGDAYMCAGGIPYKNRTNPVEVVLAALEIQEYMRRMKEKNDHIWDLRIGIHTGAVIAGVVGHKRMSYDIWGDTVNTASRMQSSGQPGKVNISGQTHVLIKDFFICEYRGKMPVKYKGDVDMYFVKGIRPELSVDLKFTPNRKFFLQLQFLRLLDIEEFVIEKMNAELNCNMHFHNANYTREVYTNAEILGRAEDVSQEELLLLKTAALFSNMGYLRSYENPETESVTYAREILPKFRYSKEQIDSICSLIMSLRYFENIKTRLEAILIDAYFSFYGRVDFLQQSRNYYREVKERIPSLSEEEWFYHEMHKAERFNFYTRTAGILREVSSEEQVRKIKDFAKIS